MTEYKTDAGSTVRIDGGRLYIEFDWVEESGACCDCRPSLYDDGLIWNCDNHESGFAELKEVEK